MYTATRSSAALAKIPMLCLQQLRAMHLCERHCPPNILWFQTRYTGEGNRIDPDFRSAIALIDMDMGQFIGFVAVKLEAIAIDA